jgi:hypothetical protein
MSVAPRPIAPDAPKLLRNVYKGGPRNEPLVLSDKVPDMAV